MTNTQVCPYQPIYWISVLMVALFPKCVCAFLFYCLAPERLCAWPSKKP